MSTSIESEEYQQWCTTVKSNVHPGLPTPVQSNVHQVDPTTVQLYETQCHPLPTDNTVSTDLHNLYEVRAALQALLDKTDQQIQDLESGLEPETPATPEEILEMLDDDRD